MPKFYEIKLDNVLVQRDKCYRKVLTINKVPDGPLASIVKTIGREKVSVFKQTCSPCAKNDGCMNVILNPSDKSEYLFEEDLAELITFIVENGYTVDTKLSKLMQARYRDVVFYITYST
jgi:hypothetical protein